MNICPDECPSTMGGSCACKKAFDCPECGWVEEHYPDCPLVTRLMELVKLLGLLKESSK